MTNKEWLFGKIQRDEKLSAIVASSSYYNDADKPWVLEGYPSSIYGINEWFKQTHKPISEEIESGTFVLVKHHSTINNGINCELGATIVAKYGEMLIVCRNSGDYINVSDAINNNLIVAIFNNKCKGFYDCTKESCIWESEDEKIDWNSPEYWLEA